MSRRSASSRSWGHGLRPMTPAELAERERQAANTRAAGYGTPERREEWARAAIACTVARCDEPRAYVARHWYATAGRAAGAERELCGIHAARYAAKHGLEAPGGAWMAAIETHGCPTCGASAGEGCHDYCARRAVTR